MYSAPPLKEGLLYRRLKQYRANIKSGSEMESMCTSSLGSQKLITRRASKIDQKKLQKMIAFLVKKSFKNLRTFTQKKLQKFKDFCSKKASKI